MAKKKPEKIKLVKVQNLFNRAIVERDGRCVICGKQSALQCSHFFTVGAHSGIRFYPDNAHTMCAGCHIKHHHADPLMYAQWMIVNYPEQVEYLQKIRHRGIKYNQENLSMILHFIRDRNFAELRLYILDLMNGVEIV